MDRDVFEQLYQKYYAPALLYAQSLCRGRHLAEAMGVSPAVIRQRLRRARVRLRQKMEEDGYEF